MPATQPDCPFCLQNQLLQTAILAETEHAFLTPARQSPGNYLIVPKTHVELPTDLSDSWWSDFKLLFAKLPEVGEHYNISCNIGEHAGQTVKHLHFWIIPRRPGMSNTGKGLAALISASTIP